MLTDGEKRCGCGAGHQTFGACLRDKRLYADGAGNISADKDWYREIDAYKSAHAQGIRPAGTRMPQIREAVELSEQAGRPYDASTGSFN